MRRPRVYVETTIPSFYFDQRRTPWMVARRRWTRAWWDVALERHDLVTGPPVDWELNQGPELRRSEWIALMAPLRILDVTDDVEQAVVVYRRDQLMPRRGLDAMHLALASVHRCEFMATWDTRHLANALKVNHIRKINQRMGLYVPTVATPLQMLGRLP